MFQRCLLLLLLFNQAATPAGMEMSSEEAKAWGAKRNLWRAVCKGSYKCSRRCLGYNSSLSVKVITLLFKMLTTSIQKIELVIKKQYQEK